MLSMFSVLSITLDNIERSNMYVVSIMHLRHNLVVQLKKSVLDWSQRISTKKFSYLLAIS